MQQYAASCTSVMSASVVRSVSQWASYARGRWKRATRKYMRRKASGTLHKLSDINFITLSRLRSKIIASDLAIYEFYI